MREKLIRDRIPELFDIPATDIGVASEEGLSVPRDVSLGAFDDMPWMSMVEPGISTILQPTADMARGAAELALRRLREGRQGAPSTIPFPTQLIERDSVGPLRKAKPTKVVSST